MTAVSLLLINYRYRFLMVFKEYECNVDTLQMEPSLTPYPPLPNRAVTE
jgi:hypothetical protein